MKIIEKKDIPAPTKPWWMDRIIICDSCGSKLQFDETDNPSQFSERRPNGAQWILHKCPVCNKILIIYKNNNK